jgi:hypothetical protein
MQRLVRGIALALLVAGFWGYGLATASAKPRPPVKCSNPSRYGVCVVGVGAPGHGGGSGHQGGGGGSSGCVDHGQTVPCERPGLGAWDASLGCYLKLMASQPPKSNPLWQGHKTGAIYWCTTWPPRSTGISEIWLATPPVGPDPRTLAVEAERTLRLPQPSGNRSPSQAQRFHGYPFSYVNLWTWFWTDRQSWRTRSATATAGGVSATVTVRPTALAFDPGDGSSPVTCAGPGRAWTSTDGNGRPSGGGCGYRYRSATNSPVTSVQSIRWSVSWRASDGESGTLPDLTTSRTGELMVMQVESVVTR